MHDFCFTPVYAAILVFGGMIGFYAAGSATSLAAGAISAVILGALCYISMNHWLADKGKCVPAVVGSLCVSLAITGMMGKRVIADPNLASPSTITGFISLCMSGYYVWNLAFFRPQIHKTKPSKKKAVEITEEEKTEKTD